MKVSALIPTYNEEKNIRDCLESLQWAEEIIVVDSYSEDSTREIAREFTDRVYQHEYVNSATQKNWALDNLEFSNRWVLIVDADERCTDELRTSIESKSENPGYDGYWIYRENHFLGKKIKHCGWNKDKVLRLFKKEKGRYKDKEVHAQLNLSGKENSLEGKLKHFTYRDFESYFEKFNRYSTWGARQLYKDGKKGSVFKIITRPVCRFLRTYFLFLGFLDGVHGLILSSLAGMSVFAKYVKLWHFQQSEEIFKDEDSQR